MVGSARGRQLILLKLQVNIVGDGVLLEFMDGWSGQRNHYRCQGVVHASRQGTGYYHF